MFLSDFCGVSSSPEERKSRFQQRKLEMLKLFRDSLERRIASVTASIATLEQQIERDSALVNN